MSQIKQIINPSSLFSLRKNKFVSIIGRFVDENNKAARTIFVKLGKKIVATRPNEAGEFELNFLATRNTQFIKIIAAKKNGSRIRIATRIIRFTDTHCQSKHPFNKTKNLQKIYPSSYLNFSEDGSVKISGFFSDKDGNPPKKIIASVGNRTIECKCRDGNEFRFTIKTGKGLKLFKVEVLTRSNVRMLVGRRLFYVSKFPEISLSSRICEEHYQMWLHHHEKPSFEDEKRISALLGSLSLGPKFSILINGNTPPVEFTEGTIGSIQKQLFENWELIVTSSYPSGFPFLSGDNKISLLPNKGKAFDSVQFNLAAVQMQGDYMVFLSAKERLPLHALMDAALSLKSNPKIKLLYGDDDEIQIGGYRSNPDFKASFDPIRLLNHNYIGRNFIIRRDLFDQLKGFREEENIDVFHDLLIRSSKLLKDEEVLHVPRILRHRLKSLIPQMEEHNAKRINTIKRNLSLKDWLMSNNKGIFYTRPQNSSSNQLVSIIIPSACKIELHKPCISSIFSNTKYKFFEIILIVNEIRYQVPEQSKFLSELETNESITIVKYPDQPFNYSYLINLGVSHVKGEKICLLNDDIEIISPDWLDEMLAWLSIPKVGAVGARLLFPDKKIQHAGITLGMNGIADHTEKGTLREDAGDFARILFPRLFSAVTGGCMVMEKKTFEQINGFDENLAQAYNDVDFCIRLKNVGFKIIWTPFAEFYHHESVSVERPFLPARREIFRGELEYMLGKHEVTLRNDPFYSPNHSDIRPYFKLAFPPRNPAPWKETSTLSWDLREPEESKTGNTNFRSEKVAIFSHYDIENIADPYISDYLFLLKELGWSIIFVTSSDTFSDREKEKVAPFVSLILKSNGKGRDWGNFALGLNFVFSKSIPESVLLLNDSLYGPFGSLDEIFEKANSLNSDFVGLTDSPQHQYHLQSYFIYCKPALCTHLAFLRFWQQFRPQPTKDLIINRNEIDFTQYFVNLGFRPGAIFSYNALFDEAVGNDYSASSLLKKDEHVNPTHYFWDILLTVFDFPFVKVELLRENPSKIPGLSLLKAYLRKNHPAKAKLVFDHLDRTGNK